MTKVREGYVRPLDLKHGRVDLTHGSGGRAMVQLLLRQLEPDGRDLFANLGGRRLADLLGRCETAARENGDLVAARRAAMGLKAHYAALVAALGAEVRRSNGANASTG